MSDNVRNAPALYLKGEKWIEENEQRISVADRLMKAIGSNKKLNANDRLLLILFLGQANGFHPSERWVLERTGMSADTYHSCRKKLNKLGYIEYEQYKHIIININALEDN